MIILAICTEGENSEPNYLIAYKKALFGTTPGLEAKFEIVPVPLRGNHGHKKIFEKANMELARREQDPMSLLSVIDGADDVVEKWIIVDYDKMEKHGINEKEFRQKAIEYGYNDVINKPNFELFILCHFIPIERVKNVKPSQYEKYINSGIDNYNKTHGYDHNNQALKLPSYSKNKYASSDLFEKLLSQNNNLLDIVTNESFAQGGKNHYSDMYKLFERLNKK